MPKNYKVKMKKETAIKRLSDVIERAKTWNEKHAHFYQISDLLLVGSLARNEEFVGDIDLCVNCTQKNRHIDCTSDKMVEWYLNYRLKEFGYKPSSSWNNKFEIMYTDPARYLKNSDGRIEILGWDQREVISLTRDSQSVIIKDACFQHDNALDVIFSSKPVSEQKISELIAQNVPSPRKRDDAYFIDYVTSLARYPDDVRNRLLERDGSHQDILIVSPSPSLLKPTT